MVAARRGALLATAAFATLLALAAAAPPAHATLYLGPTRPLTRAETVSTTVHEAQRIAVSDLVSYRLTDVDPAAGLKGYLPYHVTFRPRRWLKGNPGAAELEVCWWPPPDERQKAPPAGSTFVLFTVRPDARSPLADSCAWFAIQEGPPWLLPPLSPWTPGLEDEVRRAIANQEPEALVLRSDRVVLGTLEREFRGWDKAGSPLPRPTFVRVQRALKGSRTPARLPVRVVDERAVDANDTRPHLFFLRRTDDGTYEPVELIAGVLPAFGGRVPDWDLSLDEAVRRIERAVAEGEAVRRRAKAAIRSK
jgi:hypothetical protein